MIKNLIKELIYFFGSLSLIRRFMRQYRGRASILCYHRVVDKKTFHLEDSPQKNLLVSKVNFESHVKLLSNAYDLVSMDDLVYHLKSKSSDYKVAITFDDGYKDNLINALPILEKYNIPAIIYVCTRFLDNDCSMWWYQLWDHITKSKKINYFWEGLEFSFDTGTISKKHKVYNHLSNTIKTLNYKKQNELLKLICNQELINYKSLCLSWEEVIKLSKNPLITIGCHTNTHSSLKYLTNEEIYFELYDSKKLIEENINQKVNHLAYPYGTRNDISKEINNLAKKYGYKSAVETTITVLNHKEQLFSLPRISTYDSNSQKIESKLSGLDNFIFSKK